MNTLVSMNMNSIYEIINLAVTEKVLWTWLQRFHKNCNHVDFAFSVKRSEIHSNYNFLAEKLTQLWAKQKHCVFIWINQRVTYQRKTYLTSVKKDFCVHYSRARKKLNFILKLGTKNGSMVIPLYSGWLRILHSKGYQKSHFFKYSFIFWLHLW